MLKQWLQGSPMAKNSIATAPLWFYPVKRWQKHHSQKCRDGRTLCLIFIPYPYLLAAGIHSHKLKGCILKQHSVLVLFNVRQWNMIPRGPVGGMHFKAYQTPKTPHNSLYHWPTGFNTSVILLSLLADSILSHHTLFWQRCLYRLVQSTNGLVPFHLMRGLRFLHACRLSNTSELITEVMVEVWTLCWSTVETSSVGLAQSFWLTFGHECDGFIPTISEIIGSAPHCSCQTSLVSGGQWWSLWLLMAAQRSSRWRGSDSESQIKKKGAGFAVILHWGATHKYLWLDMVTLDCEFKRRCQR